jgi:hypothetical protein
VRIRIALPAGSSSAVPVKSTLDVRAPQAAERRHGPVERSDHHDVPPDAGGLRRRQRPFQEGHPAHDRERLAAGAEAAAAPGSNDRCGNGHAPGIRPRDARG